MNETHPPVAPAGSAGLADDADVVRAEGLLFDLAGKLLRAPVQGTLRLHLRALQIKRIVGRWFELPDEASRHAVIDELLALHHEVRALREN